MQGPEALLAKLSTSLPGAVVPDQPALLERKTRTVVNGHFFWVSSAEQLAVFRAAPQRYTGPLLDPLTHEWFAPSADPPRRDTPEGILLFSSPATARAFDSAGQTFAGHGH